jgi:hypothetical protein
MLYPKTSPVVKH